MTHRSHLFFIIASIVLLGVGCNNANQGTPSSETPAPAATSTAAASTADIPEVALTALQQDYLYCFNRGFEPDLRFSGRGDILLLCVFTDGSACGAHALRTGGCKQESPAISRSPSTTIAQASPIRSIRQCEGKADPVCGTDGKTYTSRCIAELQKIRIAADGICTTPIAPAPETPNARPSSPTPSAPGGAQPSQPNEPPSWLSALVSLSGNNSSDTQSVSVYRCDEQGKTYYLESDACGSTGCFRTLYNTAGSVLCFPNNDLSGSCPSFIAPNKLPQSCKKIRL